jgi:transposase
LKLREDENAARLLSIPGIGTITASLPVSEIGCVSQYAGGRNFAAATGLVPRQRSTGGRGTLCGVSVVTSTHVICLYKVPGRYPVRWQAYGPARRIDSLDVYRMALALNGIHPRERRTPDEIRQRNLVFPACMQLAAYSSPMT